MGSPGTTIVRPTAADEADALRTLRLRALADTPAAFASDVAGETELADEHWAALVTGGEERTVVVAQTPDGRLVGMAGGNWVERELGVARLWGLWVAAEARRGGVGAALVDGVRAWASAHGGGFLRLGVFEEAGDGVATFYRALGFVALDDPVPMRTDPTRLVTHMVRPL